MRKYFGAANLTASAPIWNECASILFGNLAEVEFWPEYSVLTSTPTFIAHTVRPDLHTGAMARLSNLIPLLILVLVVAGGAYVAYQLYVWSNQMTQRGKQHMEKKNMTFTKDGGLKVGVKEMRSEAYEDRTQK